MITAALLLVCLVLAGALAALAVVVRRLAVRVQELASAPAVEETSRPLVEEVAPPLVEEVAQQPSRDQAAATGERGLVEGANAPFSTSDGTEFVITQLGHEAPEEPAPAIEARLFADIVLRESVVKAASWAHGVRQGLSPANRNRIWFEMRREVKRARKERKAEEREAIREWRARKRAAVRMPSQEESAA